MINRLCSIIILLLLISCGSTKKEIFNIDLIKTKEYLKNNDQIEFTINNPLNKNITNLQFKIDNNLVNLIDYITKKYKNIYYTILSFYKL